MFWWLDLWFPRRTEIITVDFQRRIVTGRRWA